MGSSADLAWGRTAISGCMVRASCQPTRLLPLALRGREGLKGSEAQPHNSLLPSNGQSQTRGEPRLMGWEPGPPDGRTADGVWSFLSYRKNLNFLDFSTLARGDPALGYSKLPKLHSVSAEWSLAESTLLVTLCWPPGTVCTTLTSSQVPAGSSPRPQRCALPHLHPHLPLTLCI